MHRNLYIYIAIGFPLWDTVPNRQSSDHGFLYVAWGFHCSGFTNNKHLPSGYFT